jgi:hypothetical protein
VLGAHASAAVFHEGAEAFRTPPSGEHDALASAVVGGAAAYDFNGGFTLTSTQAFAAGCAIEGFTVVHA